MADLAIGTERDDLTGLLGAAIRERRSLLPMSQDELAVRSGLHRTFPMSNAAREILRLKPSKKSPKPCRCQWLSFSKIAPSHRKWNDFSFFENCIRRANHSRSPPRAAQGLL